MASDKTSAEQAARHLDNLAVQFNERADQDRSAAQLLAAAANFVRAQQAENDRLVGELAVQKAVAAENEAKAKGDVELVRKLVNRTADIARADKSGAVTLRANVIGSMETAAKVLEGAFEAPVKSQDKAVVVPVDESKSQKAASVDILNVLIGGSGGMVKEKLTPLKRSLDAAVALSRAGKNVSTFLWGDSSLVSFDATMSSYDDVARMLRGGSEFSPVARYMRDDRVSQSFVILSDGDILNSDEAFREMEKLLTEVPKTIVDFMVIGDRESTPMGDFAKKLADKYPDQVTFRAVGSNNSVMFELKQIAKFRGVKDKPKPKQYFMSTNKIPGLKK